MTQNVLNNKRLKSVKKSDDTVPFYSFHDELPHEKSAHFNEPFKNDELKWSPQKLKDGVYQQFSILNNSSSNRLSKLLIFLVFIFMAIFLISIFYLMQYYYGHVYMHKLEQRSDVYVEKYLFQEYYKTNDTKKILEDRPNKYNSSVNEDNKTPSPTQLNASLKFFSAQCNLKQEERFDCHPQPYANQKDCESRGCCWVPLIEKNLKNISEGVASIGVPHCFFPENYQTYKYVNVTETLFGLEAYLKQSFDHSHEYHGSNHIEVLQLIVKYETESRLHIKILDPMHVRYEPPYPEVPIVDKAADNLTYKFLLDPLKQGFKILRKSDDVVLFDALDFRNLIYTDQFLQISTKLPSSNVYGIGETVSRFLLSSYWTRYTLFNHDSIPDYNKNGYGSHPFYMVLENTGKAHGVFLLNSNAMDVVLQPGSAITFRPIGGILDFYFFLGPTPADVISQYTEVIGKPYMPPYWGLGFHLSRFGYKSANDTRNILLRNIDAGIPIDTQWNDLDYMDNHNDFTYDKLNFKNLPDFVKELHDWGMHYIPLIDPGVSAGEAPGTYPPYDEGVAMDIFVKNASNQLFVGKVWNLISTVFPDFTNSRIVDYWTLMLQNFYAEIPFDGTWIDMNEPSNFLSGSFDGCPDSKYEKPPYLPYVEGGVLKFKSMCMTAKHYAGLHYNLHNLYGLYEAIVTNFALAKILGRRPMVISRSTFAGHGHFAGHWSGDVVSSWRDMKLSIPQLLSFSLYGIPLMGADICGFNGNTTEALCNRWMQLGAFYPFSRNHNTDDGIPQDPAAMGEQVVKSSVKALNVRYTLLPYLYTLFWAAHVKGETVARPLLFEFTTDSNTYDIDTQFLWGPALMIIPVLEEDAVTVNGYFPEGVWYNYYTREGMKSGGHDFNISAPLDTIPIFVRGGYILPQQKANMTTTESRKSKIDLLAASDLQENGNGQLYWDDGDSLNTYEENRYSLTEFELKKGVLRIQNLFGSELPPNLGLVTILGVQSPVKSVAINSKPISVFSYNQTAKYLSVGELDLPFTEPIVITWK